MAAVEHRLRACLGLDPAAVSVLYFAGDYAGDCTGDYARTDQEP